jgi:hypothetical protein
MSSPPPAPAASSTSSSAIVGRLPVNSAGSAVVIAVVHSATPIGAV